MYTLSFEGNFLWAPTPSVTDLVLRKLEEAVHKWPNKFDVFIIPKLMMMVWGRLILNMYDLVVYIPQGAKFWPSLMHEYFVIVFNLSFQTSLGGSGGYPRLWDWVLRCLLCYGKLQEIQGML